MNTSSTLSPAQPAMVCGERLRDLREAQGWDIAKLAKRLALSPGQLSQLETNQGSLFYTDAIRLTAARKVSEFLGEPLPLPSYSVEQEAALPAASASNADRHDDSGQAQAGVSLPHPRRHVVKEPRSALSGRSAALW